MSDERVRIDCNLGTILYYALKKLVDDGVCTYTSGFVGQNPDLNWVPPSTNYYNLTARKQQLLNAEAATWSGELTVTVNAAAMLDIAMRDTISLVKTDGDGVGSMINKVIQSLHLYDMTNGSFYFLAQPLRYDRQGDVRRDIDSGSHNYNWSHCEISFAFVYGENPLYFNPTVNDVSEFTDGYDGGFA